MRKQLGVYIGLMTMLAGLLSACTGDTTCRRDMEVKMVVSLRADSLNEKGHSVKYTNGIALRLRWLVKMNYG